MVGDCGGGIGVGLGKGCEPLRESNAVVRLWCGAPHNCTGWDSRARERRYAPSRAWETHSIPSIAPVHKVAVCEA